MSLLLLTKASLVTLQPDELMFCPGVGTEVGTDVGPHVLMWCRRGT